MDIRYLKGVGAKRAEQLEKLGLRTVDDLLAFYPRDYMDWSQPYPVASAPYDVKCVVKATVYARMLSGRVKVGKPIDVYKRQSPARPWPAAASAFPPPAPAAAIRPALQRKN